MTRITHGISHRKISCVFLLLDILKKVVIQMVQYVLSFNEIDKSSLPFVGGKGANLGEMSRAGFPTPQGFCITTSAYRAFLGTSDEMDELLSLLDQLKPDQLDEIRNLGKR